MNFISAQFSIKFPRQIKIRRYANDIEDVLSEHYGAPQVFSMPDDFAADAPRLIFISKGNHSQITISQMAIDFVVNFDNDFVADFQKTKNYVLDRIDKIIKIFERIDIDKYYFCGLTYTYSIDTDGNVPEKYMEDKVGELGSLHLAELYDASWSKTYVEGEYYINEHVGIGRKIDGAENMVPDLFTLVNNKVIEERVVVALDINNRLRYISKGVAVDKSGLEESIDNIMGKMEDMLIGRNNA